MGAKGTKIPPSSLQVWLNKKGANPGKWPLDNWQLPLPSTQHCEPTNPMVLTDEHLNGSWPDAAAIEIKTPLSYLYKPQTQGLLGSGGGGLMNLFTLPNAECVGANKVLLFATGAAVATGDVPGIDCTDMWANRVYTAFDSVAGTYASTVPDFINGIGDGPWTATDDYTFSAWIKPQAKEVGDSNLQYIANHLYCVSGPSCGTTWAMWRDTGPLEDDSGGNRLYIQIGREGAKRVERTAAALSDDTWYHVAFTWKRHDVVPTIGDFVAYVDGVVAPSGFIPPLQPLYPINITYGKLIVGAKGSSEDDEGSVASDFWNGSMDELSYWKTNLNAAEVFEIFSSSLYCSDGPGNLNMHSQVNNLIAWWRMGENGDDTPGTGQPGIPDLALNMSWKGGTPADLYIPAEPNNPSFQSEDFLSGALASSGLYIGNPPWIRVTGTFPNGNQNLIMLPGARVELTWNPGVPPQPGNFWSTEVMHSGCYSCSTLGPKAYLTGPLDMSAALRAWPPP